MEPDDDTAADDLTDLGALLLLLHGSLTDHWEWTWGSKQRFGLLRVDYATQKRTIKDGGRWYADLIRRTTLESALAFPKGGAS